MVAASYLPQRGEDKQPSSENRIRKLLPILALRILLPLMVLTKTTAIFLVPSIAWLIFSRAGYRIKPALKFGGSRRPVGHSDLGRLLARSSFVRTFWGL